MATSKNQKVNLTSSSLSEEKLFELKRILPEAFSENKIEWDKLRTVLGNNVDLGIEKFGFTWAGKSNAIKNVLIPSKATLTPAIDESVKFDESENIFIEGDNLEVLKLLQKAYFEKVKMIYIDPPYNTGSDFVYKDNFASPVKNYLEQTGQIDSEGNKLSTNKETNGRYHSDWLSMMYPRLKLAWNLLRDDGAIFVSIDDHEAHNLQNIMNEIYGEENFVGRITSVNNLKGRNDKKNLSTINDYLLIYQKSSSFETYGLPLSNEQIAEYKLEDDAGEKYKFRDLRKRGRPDRREDRPNMYFPIYFNQKLDSVFLQRQSPDDIEITPLRGDGSDGRWRWGKDKVAANLAILHPKYNKNKDKWSIEHRVYLSSATSEEIPGTDDLDEDEEILEVTRSRVKSVWMGGEFSTDVGRREMKELFGLDIGFDYPKPTALIERCLQLSTKNNDIILDFFAGSGTSAQAVTSLNSIDGGNRRWICVQLPERVDEKSLVGKNGFKNIAEITKERIRLAIKKLRSTDGFKVFKLTKSNYPENTFEFDPDKTVEENGLALEDYLKQAKQAKLIDDIDETSIIYENIVKEGFSLNSNIAIDVKVNNKIYTVTDGERHFFICLDRQIDNETIKNIIEWANGTIFICFDSALNDSGKANLGLQLELKTI